MGVIEGFRRGAGKLGLFALAVKDGMQQVVKLHEKEASWSVRNRT